MIIQNYRLTMNSWGKIVKDRKCWENKMEKKFDIDNELEMLLDDQLNMEVELLEKELFADEDFEDYQETPEECKASYEKLVERLKADGIYREEKNEDDGNQETGSEDKDAVNVESDDSDENKDEKYDTRKKFERIVAKAAGIVIVSGMCIFAASLTSEANRNYLINNVRILTGYDTRVINSNDESNDLVVADEHKAITVIEEELKVEVPEFYYRPENFKFCLYEVYPIAGTARMEYEYNNQLINFQIDKNQEFSTSYINNMHGEELEKIWMMRDEIEVSLGKVKASQDESACFYAKWEESDVGYFLFGKIELDELRKIVQDMGY